MSDYTIQDTKKYGNWDAGHNMEIWVLGCKNVSQSALDSAYAGVKDALGQINNRSSKIPGSVVRKVDTSKAIDCNNHWDSGNNWLDSHGFGAGVYLWVTGCQIAVAAGGGGWEKRRQAFVSTSWYGSGYYLSVMAIQESFHPFILHGSCAYVQDLTNGTNEHALGQDIDTPNGDKASPMVTSYEDDSENYESKGECNRDVITSNVTRGLTNCTVEAIEWSKDHAYWNGVH
ncbi:hypothetical protein [Haladaptatus sp. DFWS20]|uniref:hypothetical protein n=1 Tax=Haladaptatus sp. DFWS20 TaxID=3403467 RepID=UPI003EBF651C